jgi:glyoxylase-like metal-dependent hydrolase (beta-lactamase superfamily II)
MGWDALLYGPDRLGLYNTGARALFSGDVLSEAGVPNLWGGSSSYLATLAEVEKLDCRVVVPASGPIAQGKRAVRERIERDRGYVYSLLRHVQTTMAAPATLDRALEAARSVYGEYPFLEAHLDNLRSVWREMQGQ